MLLTRFVKPLMPEKRRSEPSRQFSKNFPALENKISNGGNFNFQGRKNKFPTLESFFSNAGKLQFHGKEVVKLP